MNSTPSESLIQTEIVDAILRICINRPEKKNALTVDMYNQLTDAIKNAERNDMVRVIFIYGQGTCFCSGNDLKDFINHPNDAVDAAGALLYSIHATAKPVVAAVNGPAVGIGTTMLLHCDLIYAAESAKFILPFIDLGLCPEGGASYILPRMFGYQKAAELLLLGEPLTAIKAESMGLVNQILGNSEVVAYAFAQAKKLAAKSPNAINLTKSLMKKSDLEPVKNVMSNELICFRERLSTADFKKAVNSFFGS